ncbi:hypothetical protein RZE82_07310 [Mollicutes bacterium LVI A0039]|nr:hypothetical protein RZE82_07310 [Mollicutes bacterium LVI A0039]
MKKYLIDTEFIRATKDRVHFIEVALLDQDSNQIIDFHIDAKLNGWEKKYFTRALSGHYGERTKQVFEAVDVIYSGRFPATRAQSICQHLSYDYQYKRVDHADKLIRPLANTMLFGWDISNDKELFNVISPRNVQLVDVQAMWRLKFGGKQLSLIDAYKYAIYNQNQRDSRKLIEYAHFACCDVLLLEVVMNFIETYSEEIDEIPIEKQVRDKKLDDIEQNVKRWKQQEANLISEIEAEIDEQLHVDMQRKLVRLSRKIESAKHRNEALMSLNVYEKPWW